MCVCTCAWCYMFSQSFSRESYPWRVCVCVLWRGYLRLRTWWMVVRVRGLDPGIRTGSQITRPACAKVSLAGSFLPTSKRSTFFICSISNCQATGSSRSAIRKVVQNNDSLQVHRSRRVNEGMFTKSLNRQLCTHLSCSEHAWEVLFWTST